MEFKEKSARHQRIDFDTEDSEDSDLSNIDGGADAIDLAYQEAYDYIYNYTSVNEDIDKVEYGLFDVDGDGVPELLFNAYKGQKATNYGGYIYDEIRVIFVSYYKGEVKETFFTDQEYTTSGYTFTGHTDVISTTTLKNAGAQSEFYTERYYKYENGSLTRLPDEVELEYGRFGFVYRMGDSEISEDDYLAFREEVMGDSKIYSSVKRGCSNVGEFVELSKNTADAFKIITEYAS